ncbi:MAG: hypothetical protein KA369_04995 [Spirochaetes bacterium]|nr:hypothetical protein [Spirochaetota bacterium]
MKKGLLLIILQLAIPAIILYSGIAYAAGRVPLGMISIEAPQGWDLSAEEKRIIGKPAAAGNASSRDWYALDSELFVMLGPEPDSGRELSVTLKKFMEDTFVGYAEIELKRIKLKLPSGIENLGYSGGIRNRSSGDIMYAAVMVLRFKGSHYFFVYNINKEEPYKKFSSGPFIFIMNSIRTTDGSEKNNEDW